MTALKQRFPKGRETGCKEERAEVWGHWGWKLALGLAFAVTLRTPARGTRDAPGPCFSYPYAWCLLNTSFGLHTFWVLLPQCGASVFFLCFSFMPPTLFF